MRPKYAVIVYLLLFQLSISQLSAVPGPSFISVSRSQGQAIGIDDPYTSVDILSFIYSEQAFLPFLNIQADYLDKGAGVFANVGGGIRYIPESSSIFFGLNAYYDYREVHQSNFSRLGLGIEVFGDRFGFRANGYAPVGKRNALISTCVFDNYIGDYFMIRNKYLTNQGGGDFSFDVYLRNEPGAVFRIGLGGYYFNGKDRSSRIFGPEYRVMADITRYLSLGVLGTYDKVFGNKVQAQITLTLPLGTSTTSEQGTFQRVQRNNSMILQDRCCWITNF